MVLACQVEVTCDVDEHSIHGVPPKSKNVGMVTWMVMALHNLVAFGDKC